MRFKKFLIEEEDSFDEMIKLVKGDYSDAFNLKTKLYRGLTSGLQKPYEIRTKEKFKHSSRDEKGTKPLALRTIYELCPEWNQYPDRSKSIMMTVDRTEAESFGRRGNVVRVFPINGAKLGIAPSDFNYWPQWPMTKKLELDQIHFDFVDVFIPQFYFLTHKDFSHIRQDLRYRAEKENWFHNNYKKIFSYFKKHYVGKNVVEKFEKLAKQIIKEDEQLSNLYGRAFNDYSFLKALDKHYNGDLEKMITEMFDPDKNDFHLVTTDQIDKYADWANKQHELWTTDNCLIMSPHAVEILQKRLKNGKE